MIKYIKMKKNERKVKGTFYGIIASIIDNKKDILDLLEKLYTALKNTPEDELQNEFISKLAELIHEEGNGSEA